MSVDVKHKPSSTCRIDDPGFLKRVHPRPLHHQHRREFLACLRTGQLTLNMRTPNIIHRDFPIADLRVSLSASVNCGLAGTFANSSNLESQKESKSFGRVIDGEILSAAATAPPKCLEVLF